MGEKLDGNSELARERGRKGGRARLGKKNKKTLLKEALGISDVNEMEDFKESLIKLGKKFLKDKNKNISSFAWKELLKYTFPQKQSLDAKIKGNITFVANTKIINTPDNGS
jgi:hypothetical protein